MPSNSVVTREGRPARPSHLKVLRRLAAFLLFSCLFEGLLFHTSLYSRILEPDSTTGTVETQLQNEIKRSTPDRNQVLAVGHSRQALLPRSANDLHSGYTFASIGVGGTMARCWYYELRAVDPTAKRYSAILIPADDFNEPDEYDDLNIREADLNYLLARLELRDLYEFSMSYSTWPLRWRAFSGILFKSYVYRRDFHEFLQHPTQRFIKVKLNSEHSHEWIYGYTPDAKGLDGLTMDWTTNTFHFPEGTSQDMQDLIKRVLIKERPPQANVQTAYFRHWYGRIIDHYRGSGTKLIFVRVPRAPVIPPVEPAARMDSAIRQLASQPDVVVLPEHHLDELEKPELFKDPLHLNAEGQARYTKILVEDCVRILGPAK